MKSGKWLVSLVIQNTYVSKINNDVLYVIHYTKYV